MNMFKQLKAGLVLAFVLLVLAVSAVVIPTASMAYLAKTVFTDVTAGTSTFAVSFAGGMQTTDTVEVWVNGAKNTQASIVWLSGSTLQLVGYTVSTGDDIEFRRISPKVDNLVDLEAGKTIRASSLMKNFRHVLQIGQEAVDSSYDMLTLADASVATAISAAEEAKASASVVDPEKHLYRVANMFTLTNTTATTYTAVYLEGYTTPNDGGQGVFLWDPSSVAVTDYGTIVQVSGVTSGRWIRQHNGVLNSTMFGMDKTGVVDSTQKFINLLSVQTNGVRDITLNDGTYSVNPRLLLAKVLSNTRLTFSKDAWLVASYGGRDISEVLGVVYADNVEIINPQIIGDADINPLLTEGAGHCISVRGSSNVRIIGGDISKAFTDGLYLNNNTNIEVSGGNYHDNGRQGISLISGDNIYIHDVKCTGSYRVAPKGGIDIEPNYADNKLKNIRIYNIETANNLGGGLIMTLHGVDNEVDVTIDGHTDRGSTGGTRLSCYPMVTHTPSFKPGSRVTYRNGRSLDSTIAGMQIIWEAGISPELIIDSPWVYNPNRGGGTNERQQNVGISIHNEISGYIGTKIGNISLIKPKITMEGSNTILRGIYAGYNLGVTNLKIVDPIGISIGDTANLSNSVGHELVTVTTVSGDVVNITDAFGALSLTSPNSVIRNYSSSFYTNIISSYTSGSVTLDRFLNFGKTETLFVTKSNSTNLMTVSFPVGITFINASGTVVSTSATSTTANSILKFEKVSPTIYKVIAVTGTWTIT